MWHISDKEQLLHMGKTDGSDQVNREQVTHNSWDWADEREQVT